MVSHIMKYHGCGRHILNQLDFKKIFTDIIPNYNDLIIILNTKYLYMIIGYLFASYKYNTKKFKIFHFDV